jgi:dTDP-4-dehydrorhamnose reductase
VASENREKPAWLVTGAQGFLGANAGLYLRGKARTIGLTRTGVTPNLFDEGITGDLTNPGEIAKAIIERRPTVVLHAAALASHEACEADPALAERINVDATRVLAQAAQEAGAQFIYISTDAVFDGSRGDYTETDEPSPFSVYGETKLGGEQQALNETAALIVRTNFFGWSPSGHRSILEFFVNELSAGHKVQGYTDFVVTSTYVQYLLDSIWRLPLHEVTGIVNVVSSDRLSKNDFGRETARVFALRRGLIEPVEATLSQRHKSRSRDLSLDTAKLAQLLRSDIPSQARGIQAASKDSSARLLLLRANSQESSAS